MLPHPDAKEKKREEENGIEYKAACITIFFIRYKSLELFPGLEMASWTCPPRRKKKIQPVTAEVKRISIFFSLYSPPPPIESMDRMELCEDIFINSWMILFLIHTLIHMLEGSFIFIIFRTRFYFYFPSLGNFVVCCSANFFGNRFR